MATTRRTSRPRAAILIAMAVAASGIATARLRAADSETEPWPCPAEHVDEEFVVGGKTFLFVPFRKSYNITQYSSHYNLAPNAEPISDDYSAILVQAWESVSCHRVRVWQPGIGYVLVVIGNTTFSGGQ